MERRSGSGNAENTGDWELVKGRRGNRSDQLLSIKDPQARIPPGSNGRSIPSLNRDFNIFIRNISFDTTMEDLFRILSKFGKVLDTYIPTVPGSFKPRGFGFARFRYE
ncbi:serine/arginine-rich splicing factor SC35-like [Magnolia sinica]|uniref:serine/arginine-rich splicing factor SC35-like n=1 Tax=Magnolia sinica TaxID=86752 RepID=UPI00265A41A1|nr:serine/arginine-rich splicing factor SC35-like [Magnolia sinica]